jgi:hypothetical protein
MREEKKRIKMLWIKLSRAGLLVLLTFFTSCGGREEGSTRQPAKLSQFEQDLQTVRNGQYLQIWVVSRKDGAKLEKDDIAFIRENTPLDGRRVIMGTNFDLTDENKQALMSRLNLEDYSPR